MTEPVKRAASIEEPTNAAIFVPISGWLVPIFARWKISANMLSVTGLVSGALGGVAYHYYDQTPLASLLGLSLMAIWHVMDCADGQLARFTNTQSELGKIIDGICDYVVFISVYVALALALAPVYGPNIWYLVSIAGLFHAMQAASYEFQRQEFDFWGLGHSSAAQPELAERSDDLKGGAAFANLIARGYARMQKIFTGLDPKHRQALIDHLADETVDVEKFRLHYQKAYAPMVMKWGVMCPHYRTYAIFIACIIGYPIIFFLMTAVFLPVVHLYLIQKQRKFNRAFIQSL